MLPSRLGRDQRLDDKAGVEGDRIWKRQLLILDREHAATDRRSANGPASACRSHGALPSAVHVWRDADLDPEALGGPLQGRSSFLDGLVSGRVSQFSQPLGAEPLDLPVGLRLCHGLHDGSSSLVRKAVRLKWV